MKNALFVVIFSVFASAASAQSGIRFEHESWKNIIAKAKSEKKLVFLDAYTSWCGPCKAMQARVFPEKTLGDFFNVNFVNAKVDMEQGEGPALANRYPIQGYPTLLFIDPNSGKIVTQVLGYQTTEQLLQLGMKANSKKKI
ncbi:thioredoxin fold domain-containing protein [Emticicia sp. CRIBPO]|uniref:thioredoxin family protein n=1 Tax=Emticicia sp. CRIBPO TaxID=2683258 RepID=UPI001412B18B|nr:thioredoxin family protein [Emticicia sp. CRIBPO]NBA84449.1 thioredoxin fold domain-containing protein [Emticicia sp. CRIBPO]